MKAADGNKLSPAKKIIGWIAVTITVIFTNLWTYWGIVENFHEGWYSESLLENLQMLFLQYLLLPIVSVFRPSFPLGGQRSDLAYISDWVCFLPGFSGAPLLM